MELTNNQPDAAALIAEVEKAVEAGRQLRFDIGCVISGLERLSAPTLEQRQILNRLRKWEGLALGIGWSGIDYKVRALQQERDALKAGWLPIATAPKDGTCVLLRSKSGYVNRPYRCHVGRWATSSYPSPRGWWEQGEGFHLDGDEPTHWMALPAPPAEGTP